jgi:hypothetical protein
VMRRVPAFDGAAVVCAMLSCASATMLMPIRVVNNSDDSFCMFSSVWQGGKILDCLPSLRTIGRHPQE